MTDDPVGPNEDPEAYPFHAPESRQTTGHTPDDRGSPFSIDRQTGEVHPVEDDIDRYGSGAVVGVKEED